MKRYRIIVAYRIVRRWRNCVLICIGSRRWYATSFTRTRDTLYVLGLWNGSLVLSRNDVRDGNRRDVGSLADSEVSRARMDNHDL